mgnify:FL=1
MSLAQMLAQDSPWYSMTEYRIEYTRKDMPEGYVGRTLKWAHNPNDAVKLILQKNPDKTGTCVFKRGGTGKIISVEEVT